MQLEHNFAEMGLCWNSVSSKIFKLVECKLELPVASFQTLGTACLRETQTQRKAELRDEDRLLVMLTKFLKPGIAWITLSIPALLPF